MGFKNPAVFSPPVVVESARRIQALDRTVCHVQGVVRIIMRKQSLAAEGKHMLKLADPVIQK